MTIPSSASAAAAPASVHVRPPRRRRLMLKISVVLVVVIVAGLALWSEFSLTYRYATGEHTGYVRSLTKNGWLCKTWEGEMSIAPIPGAPGQNFQFTVRSDSLAALLQGAQEKRVTLAYSQHVAIPSRCFGDTPYYIEGVHVTP